MISKKSRSTEYVVYKSLFGKTFTSYLSAEEYARKTKGSRLVTIDTYKTEETF